MAKASWIGKVKLKKTWKKAWVKALRSGKYAQGSGELCRNGEYCCLGVLTVISGGATLDSETFADVATCAKTIEKGVLADVNSMQQTLANMNDGTKSSRAKSFTEIADFIEKTL